MPILYSLLACNSHVDFKDISGKTPLHWAAIEGNLEAAKALLQREADINAKDGEDNTPLQVAARNGHSKVFESALKEVGMGHLVQLETSEKLLENEALDAQTDSNDLNTDTTLVTSTAKRTYKEEDHAADTKRSKKD